MRRLLLVLLAALVFASAASAGNVTNAKINAIATNVAGFPVGVYCENDDIEWASWEMSFEFYVAGFTFPDVANAGLNISPFALHTLYIAPPWCTALIGLTQGEDVGTFLGAEAMLVLTHEAMHQKLNSMNEAVVECSALKALRDVAVRLFGVPETVTEPYMATVVKRVKRKRVRLSVLRYRSVPNPYLDRLLRDAARWDAGLPAEYHGATC